MLQIFLKGELDVSINRSCIKLRRVIMTKQSICLHSQDYHCPVNYDESEYYINILSRQNWTTDRSIELCRAFSQSSLSKIPAIENARTIFRVVPQKY